MSNVFDKQIQAVTQSVDDLFEAWKDSLYVTVEEKREPLRRYPRA